MCAYQFIYTTKINQLTVHQNLFYGVRNLVLYLKFAIFRVAVW